MEKKENKLLNIKNPFLSRRVKGEIYITITSIVVIALFLVLNIIFGELDLKYDLSQDTMFSLTEETKDFIRGIEDDITIYYLGKTGTENTIYTKIVESYSDYSNIKVEYKDPIQYPKFASNYVDDAIRTDSVLVVNHTNNRVKYVDTTEFEVYEIDYNTYEQYQVGYDVEGRVTQAISYVTKEVLPVVYEVEGHGEIPLSDSIKDGLDRANISTNSLSTMTVEAIPQDCNILLINAPQTDYLLEEVELIKSYLAAGGNAIILVDHSSMELNNFKALVEYYGVFINDGIIIEGNSNYYMSQYVNYLLPEIHAHETTIKINQDNLYVVMPETKGFTGLDSKRSTITITPLFETSEDAFSKVDLLDTTITKKKEDIEGPFYTGVEVTESYNGVETSLMIFGSPHLIAQGIAEGNNSYGNLDFFVKAVSYLAGEEESISIPAKTPVQEFLTMTANQTMTIGAITAIGIPVLILIIGGVICVKRRKK